MRAPLVVLPVLPFLPCRTLSLLLAFLPLPRPPGDPQPSGDDDDGDAHAREDEQDNRHEIRERGWGRVVPLPQGAWTGDLVPCQNLGTGRRPRGECFGPRLGEGEEEQQGRNEEGVIRKSILQRPLD